jgi:hypothetical protein
MPLRRVEGVLTRLLFVTICLSNECGFRPTSFKGGNGQALITLRRVKPGK